MLFRLREIYRQNRNFFNFVAVMLSGSALLFFLATAGSNVQAPVPDPTLDSSEAQIFNEGEFFQLIDTNQKNLVLVKKDLATFARATSESFVDNKNPVGFTFAKGYKQEDSTYVFKGNYYKIDGDITLKLKKFDKGIISLSITNEATKTNIDKNLELNGVKNLLITKLPIEKDYYSITYLYSNNAVIVAFYNGYTVNDVNEAVNFLKEAYGDEYSEDKFQFNINGVGTFDLAGVYSYIATP